METENGSERSTVALFIDLENIRYSFNNTTGGFDPDVSLFMKIAQNYGRVVNAYAFADFSRQPDLVRTALNVAGISIRDIPNKEARKGDQTIYQSSADLHMVMDIYETVLNVPNVSVFVLATGDGDFLRIITTLRNQYEKKVVVLGVPNCVSGLLKAAADEVIELELPDPIIAGDFPQQRFANGVAKSFEDLKTIIEPIIVMMQQLPSNRYWTVKLLGSWVDNPRNNIPGDPTSRASAISFMVNNGMLLREKVLKEDTRTKVSKEVTEAKLNKEDPFVKEVLIRNGYLAPGHRPNGPLSPEERTERVAAIKDSFERNGLVEKLSVSPIQEEKSNEEDRASSTESGDEAGATTPLAQPQEEPAVEPVLGVGAPAEETTEVATDSVKPAPKKKLSHKQAVRSLAKKTASKRTTRAR